MAMGFARHALTLGVATTLGACGIGGSDPLNEAQAAFAAQDHDSAQRHVQDALARDASDTAALELLARIQLAMGAGADALVTLERLDKAGGAPADAALLAAEARLQLGEGDAALQLLGGANNAEAWRLRALAAAMAQDGSRALAAFARGREAAGDKGKLYAAEASYHLSRGDLGRAAEAVALAEQAAPHRVETLFTAARLAHLQGDALLALSNYLRIVEIAPSDRPALLAAIDASERAGQGDITRHLIAYGAAAHPRDREFVYQQSRVDAWDGRWEAVRERLQAHEADLADHDPARLLYAESLLQLGQVETARAIAAPVIARMPNDSYAENLQAAIDAAS